MRFTLVFTALACTLALFACDDNVSNTDKCGDGFVDPGEECDSTVGEVTCTSLGHYNPLGTLTCRADCIYDRTGCGGRCGDGIVDEADGEVCDGANLNQTCQSLGWHGGTLSCAADCRDYDTGGCETAGRCGDGIVQESVEDCEGDDLNGADCTDLGFYRGTLACTDACAFDAANCEERCGDGVIQAGDGEACDGSNLDGRDCTDFGFHEGTLGCDACAFDTSACIGRCGDGVVQASFGEACDGVNLDGETCESVGMYRGTLACREDCSFDSSGCEFCGDGVVQTGDGEACELGDLAGATCRDVGHFTGIPSCEPGCVLGPDGCLDAVQWGTTGFDHANGVAVDAAGNLFIVGTVSASLDGQVHLGGSDIYLRKFNRNGERLWTLQFGTITADEGYGVAVDAAGDVYVAGSTLGALPGQTQGGGDDGFLAKIDTDGVLQWVRQWGDTGDEKAHAVGVNASGDLYVAGSTFSALFGEPSFGGSDVFLHKFDVDGNRLWTRVWGNSDTQVAMDLAVYPDGQVFVSGVTFGPFHEQTFIGESAVFVTIFDADGTLVRTRMRGPVSPPYRTAMATDADKNVYLAGLARTSWDGQVFAGMSDVALVKYDANGVYQWTRMWGSSSDDMHFSAATDAAGDVWVIGGSGGIIDGQTPIGGGDVFLTRHTPDGTREETRYFGTSLSDVPQDLALDPDGNFFIVGTTTGAWPGHTNAGYTDAFLLFVPAIP
jgi:hypothetical protein